MQPPRWLTGGPSFPHSNGAFASGVRADWKFGGNFQFRRRRMKVDDADGSILGMDSLKIDTRFVKKKKMYDERF